jgi:hypothetical protein
VISKLVPLKEDKASDDKKLEIERDSSHFSSELNFFGSLTMFLIEN